MFVNERRESLAWRNQSELNGAHFRASEELVRGVKGIKDAPKERDALRDIHPRLRQVERQQ